MSLLIDYNGEKKKLREQDVLLIFRIYRCLGQYHDRNCRHSNIHNRQSSLHSTFSSSISFESMTLHDIDNEAFELN